MAEVVTNCKRGGRPRSSVGPPPRTGQHLRQVARGRTRTSIPGCSLGMLVRQAHLAEDERREVLCGFDNEPFPGFGNEP